MSGRTEGQSRVHRSALLDPRFLIALVLLVANDRIFKGLWPGWVTGKLSDLTGMIVGPVVVAEVVRAFGLGRRVRAAIGVATAGLFLTSIKLSAGAAALTERILEAGTGVGHTIIIDPTDLLGLAGLVVAISILRQRWRPVAWIQRTDRRRLQGPVLAMAVMACLASGWDGPAVYSNIALADDGSLELWGSEWEGQAAVRTSSDGGRTWGPTKQGKVTSDGTRTELCLAPPASTCINIGPEARVRERHVGDDQWRTVWELDTTASWVSKYSDRSISEGEIRAFDMVELPDGTVVVAMGELDPIRRTVDGRWTPSIADLREMPWAGIGVAALATFLFSCGVAFQLSGMRGMDIRKLGGTTALTSAPMLIGLLVFVLDHQKFEHPYIFVVGRVLPLLALGFSAITGLAAFVNSFRAGDAAQRKTLWVLLIASSTGAAMLPLLFGLWANDLLAWRPTLFIATAIPLGFAAFAAWFVARQTASQVFIVENDLGQSRPPETR